MIIRHVHKDNGNGIEIVSFNDGSVMHTQRENRELVMKHSVPSQQTLHLTVVNILNH